MTKTYESPTTHDARRAFEKAQQDFALGEIPTRTLTAARHRWHTSRAKDAELERVVRDAIEGKPSTDDAVVAACAVVESRR